MSAPDPLAEGSRGDGRARVGLVAAEALSLVVRAYSPGRAIKALRRLAGHHPAG